MYLLIYLYYIFTLVILLYLLHICVLLLFILWRLNKIQSMNQHVHNVYYHCAIDQIENQTPKMLISRFKYILYGYFDRCLLFETPITQNSKITCLRTGGSNNSKSRYGNDLTFVMAL